MDNKENKKRRRGLPNQMNLVFHIVAGVYLIYLAYSIYGEVGNAAGGEKIMQILAAVLFVITGAVAALSALRSLRRGEYKGGAADPDRNAETAEETSKPDRIRFGEQKKQKESGETDRIRFGEPDTLPEKRQEEPEKESGEENR